MPLATLGDFNPSWFFVRERILDEIDGRGLLSEQNLIVGQLKKVNYWRTKLD
jgi:hypothetical protein